MSRDQNDFYSLFRVKSNSNRESRNLVTLKWYFNLLKMFSCNIAKLRYRWRNSMKFTSYIQMIQGTVISLSCNLKNILKNFVLPAEQPVSRRCDRQWFHWRTDTSSARHTQETPSANCNWTTWWADCKQRCKNFRCVNSVLIT